MYPPYGPPPLPPQEDGGATASLVLGIIGLFVCGGLLSPIALFMGISARRRIRNSGGYLGGDGNATAGIVLGAIGTAIIVLALLFVLAVVLIALVAGSSSY